jgi:plasmid stabilization system protein ParE
MDTQKKTTIKTRQIRVSTNAFQNINEISRYITFINNQPFNAVKVGDAIFKTIERIEQIPFAFKECQEISTKTKIYRQAVCLSWKIVYKITVTEIIILGIIHGSRNPLKFRALRRIK